MPVNEEETANVIPVDVDQMLIRLPLYANKLISEVDGTDYIFRNTSQLRKYYLNLDKDDPTRKAIDELATSGILKETNTNEMERSVHEVADKYKKDPSSREETKQQIVWSKKQANISEEEAKKWDKLEESMPLMLYTVAHFEDFRVKAYHLKCDRKGLYTVGLGNTKKPDGTAVTKDDMVKSETEAFLYFQSHVDREMSEAMVKTLPLDKMTPQEIAIMGSFVYNCGAGVLRKKGEPTELAKAATEYFTTHSKASEEKFKKLYCSHNRANSGVNQELVNRRNIEWAGLTGQYTMVIDDHTPTGNGIINLKKTKLGTLKLDEKKWDEINEDSNSYCPTDSLGRRIQERQEIELKNSNTQSTPRKTPANGNKARTGRGRGR